MSDPKQTIHIRIRDLRRQRALTQEELAEALGLSRQSINAMEAGRCLPSLPVAMQMAAYFSVPLGAIFSLAQEILDEQAAQRAALIPWTPMQDVRETLADLMDQRVRWQPAPVAVQPTVNLVQNEQALTLEFCLPGYKKEDIDIEVGEGFITVSGQYSRPGSHGYTSQEFTLQDFTRTINLPPDVRVNKAEAKMQDGILMITIPREVEELPKTARIQIK